MAIGLAYCKNSLSHGVTMTPKISQIFVPRVMAPSLIPSLYRSPSINSQLTDRSINQSISEISSTCEVASSVRSSTSTQAGLRHDSSCIADSKHEVGKTNCSRMLFDKILVTRCWPEDTVDREHEDMPSPQCWSQDLLLHPWSWYSPGVTGRRCRSRSSRVQSQDIS